LGKPEEFLNSASGTAVVPGGTYTTGVLRSWRWLARVTALVLLTWTAVDLGFPECCLDEQQPIGSITSSLTSYDEDAASGGDVDDCFCCALCIDTGWRTPALKIEAARTSYRDPIRQLATRVTALDHPPQNA
jgi:hypothetical protein